MDATMTTARRAGAVYFLFMIVAIVGEFVLPRAFVPDDSAATAANIASGELTYRIGILLGFLTHVIFIVLAAVLYRLFADVDQEQALLLVLFVSVGVAVALANSLLGFAPLRLLDNDAPALAFTQPQLQAMAHDALHLRRSGAAFPMMFWGLWLFPFGVLVMRSGFLPRVLGVLLLVAGVGYLVTGVTAVVLPAHQRIVSQVMTPLYVCEIPIVFWLLIKGARRRAGTTASPHP